MTDKILMVHGSGGEATGELIREVFGRAFGYDPSAPLEDAAVVEGAAGLAVTTDSFVVTPLIFAGGDIGRLSVCGTVNDLLMRGARPAYLTAGFILEEGLSVEVLSQVAASMAETAREAGVRIVTGDTKVVEGRGGLYINTAGIGLIDAGEALPSAAGAREGDVIIVSGTLGDHHAAILGERLGIRTASRSDNAPLTDMVGRLKAAGIACHALRDITRGGLATVLKELAEASAKTFVIREEAVPVTPAVRDFCGLMGLDPLYMGNEGKLAAVVAAEEADRALALIRASRYGQDAAIIGEVRGGEPGTLLLTTAIGGLRRLDILQGEGLPRIC